MYTFVALQPIVVFRAFVISIFLTAIIYLVVQEIKTNRIMWRCEDLIICYEQLIELYLARDSSKEELEKKFDYNPNFINIFEHLKSDRPYSVNLDGYKHFIIQSFPGLKKALIQSITNDIDYIYENINPRILNDSQVQATISTLKDLQNKIQNLP